MPTNNLKDIEAVVEQVRMERHPDLSASFLAAIIAIEEEHTDDDEGAQRAIDAAVSEILRSEGLS